MAELHTCPRRHDLFAPGGDRELEDTWREKRGKRFCSYCGALHPDEFMQAVRDGAELGPTDKNYKVYLDIPEASPAELRVVSATRSPETFPGPWTPVEDVDPEILERDGWRGQYTHVQLTPRGETRNCKFYWLHLSPDQQREFFRIFVDQKVRIGYPGHFYSGLLLPAVRDDLDRAKAQDG